MNFFILNSKQNRLLFLFIVSVAIVGAAGENGRAADSGPKLFSSSQDAAKDLLVATAKNNTLELMTLFGPDGKDIVISGDPSDDNDSRKEFSSLARQKMAAVPDQMNSNKVILFIGEQDWPFPVPLVRQDGKWHFDASEGRKEILARRIGANEMNAIEICRGYVEAQNDYAQHHALHGVAVYAQKVVSKHASQDGLYWDPTHGTPDSLVSKGFADAASGAPNAEPYHGYYFRVLTAQGAHARGGAVSYVVNNAMIGGFALVAWPAKYGVSGIQTFIVNHDDTVYEKHLGPDTATLVGKITEFDPDPTWKAVAE